MSEKTIAQKFMIKKNYVVLLVNEPEGYRSKLGKLPANVIVLTEPTTEPVDYIQVFVTSEKELERQLGKLKSVLRPKGLLWVAYPKGTSKINTDINRDVMREFALTIGCRQLL